jgi:RNA polymerase sigma-70 factor, ECF subfamily
MNRASQSGQYDEETCTKTASNDDLDAFNELVLRYQNMAYHHAYALLGDPDIAADATQESFIKAFQAMNGYHRGSFRAWLLRIVTNTSYDFIRRARRHPTEPLFPEDEYGEEIESPVWIAHPGPSIEAMIEEHEFSQRLYQILDELPDLYRSVVTLIDLYEFDYIEAADILKVPIGTVKSRLARARLQISKRLSPRPMSDPALAHPVQEPQTDSPSRQIRPVACNTDAIACS